MPGWVRLIDPIAYAPMIEQAEPDIIDRVEDSGLPNGGFVEIEAKRGDSSGISLPLGGRGRALGRYGTHSSHQEADLLTRGRAAIHGGDDLTLVEHGDAI